MYIQSKIISFDLQQLLNRLKQCQSDNFIVIKCSGNLMLQSQKFQQLQLVLSQNHALKNILNLIRSIAAKHDDFNSQTFINSPHFGFLVEEMNKLKIPEINQIMSQIKQPHCIVALPIKRQPKFTLFYVIVPQGQKFDWHSHPKMSGISKCIHGHLSISTIDFRFINKISHNQYIYHRNQMRVEDLRADQARNVSTIQPHALNIHRIEATELSAFFDLLMPDYPDNTCQFLTTEQQDAHTVVLRELNEPSEDIQGWDVYLQELLNRERHIVKNVILK